MLNSNIRMDLHILSYASCYKEPSYSDGSSIVGFSKKENVDVLLNKLLQNGISLFSITDHNRYDLTLYKTIMKKLKNDAYNSLNLLHGIEFDVKFESDKKVAHVIAIFDVKNEDDMNTIDSVLKMNKIEEKTGFYSKEKFETILRQIGLNTLLIVHQHCSLDNNKGKHNSLSESTADPYKIIQIGYVDALEYQKPNVEGILKNNLRNVETKAALVTGSDCHDWQYYPKHDRDSKENDRYFSKCKILPSFKGLLLGLTSTKSRFNRSDILNTNYIESFQINNNTIKLDPSINVIIGENGSGKSTLFNILSGNKKNIKGYIKTLKTKNSIETNFSNINIKEIHQAELIDKFNKDQLFDDEKLFAEIDCTSFENLYKTFAKDLKQKIEHNILVDETKVKLESTNFLIKNKYGDASTLYVSVTKDFLEETINVHTERRKKLGAILSMLVDEFHNSYYSQNEKDVLYKTIMLIRDIYQSIKHKEQEVDLENQVRNIILAKADEYIDEITELSTSQDREIHEYKTNKLNFINDIVNAILLDVGEHSNIEIPKAVSGMSRKRDKGFVFTREMNFHDNDVSTKFLEFMFTKKYQEFNSIYNICTKDEFKCAVLGCSDINKINELWDLNFQKFLKWAKEQKSYIKEETSDDSIGSTLGELSLAYYKFQTYDSKEWDVLMIDQPEDNISNNRIASKLLQYLNKVRDKKQLILVTHNPLLVINLDADNVIHLKKMNDTITVTSGCLEDEDNNVLSLVAETLDGGKEMIKKRLRVYGEND